MEANDLKIYQKQKISGNLKKLQQKFMKSFVRTCDVSFEGQFVSNLTMSLNHPMDTQCDNLLKTTYQNGQRFVRMHVVNKA